MSHSDLVQRAKDAINKVFSDTTVPQNKTEDSLQELVDEIESMIVTLDHGGDR